MKDVRRLLKGVSLIAKEFSKRSSSSSYSPNSLLYKALLSATDLSGLTRGSLRRFSKPNPNPNPILTPPLNQNQPKIDQHQDQIQNQPKEDQHHQNDQRDHDQNDKAEQQNQRQNEETMMSIHKNEGRRRPRERRVPSTPFSRALGFAGLGAGLAWGTLQESAKRLVFGTPIQNPNNASNPFLSPQNAERLALALCRMRGAALKIGQMLSIQDESLVPPPILVSLSSPSVSLSSFLRSETLLSSDYVVLKLSEIPLSFSLLTFPCDLSNPSSGFDRFSLSLSSKSPHKIFFRVSTYP